MKIVFALIALVIVGFVLLVALQPSSFRITRSIEVGAPAAVIFPEVNDLHHWQAWSPWEKMDSGMKKTFDGPMSGVGAVYRWNGNAKVGEGEMSIVKSEAPTAIDIRLQFFRPMKAINLTEFRFQPDGNMTRVEWSMSGTNNFMGKAFTLMMNMDKLVGAQFDEGLSRLKQIVESKKV